MLKRALLLAGAASIAAVPATPVHAAAKTEAVPKEPSLHVQCDGYPDNMSSGESAVRILALTAVIGLLAPPPEQADLSKRKFGADGVSACTQVLVGEKAESNPERKLKLIMARAIHQIEAKNYDQAIADVSLARQEARTSGLWDDPYFRRSMGLSFDQIEAAALLRQKKFAEADAKALASLDTVRFSLTSLLDLTSYSVFVEPGGREDLAHADYVTRLFPLTLAARIGRLHEARKFEEAAKVAEDAVQYDESFRQIVKDGKFQPSSWPLANAALAHALAGHWDLAAKRAAEARANDKRRVAEGQPEDGRVQTAEVLDLFEVLNLAHAGNIAGARRLFTGRSEWLTPSFGSVMETNRLLRAGAKPEELVGPLSKTAQDLWIERRDAKLAEQLARDTDNKSLFGLIVPYSRASAFEAVSGKVWKIDKSKILIKKKDEKDIQQVAFLYPSAANVRYDAILLHSALVARSKGYKGILFIPFKNTYGSVIVRMGNPEDSFMPASLFIDADQAIAALSPIIPEPAALKARRAAASK